MKHQAVEDQQKQQGSQQRAHVKEEDLALHGIPPVYSIFIIAENCNKRAVQI